MTSGLTTEDSDGVRRLVLDRPERRNALSQGLRGAIVDALEVAGSDDEVRVVLIAAAGEHFCAGFDLKELAEAPDPAVLFADSGRYHHAVHTFPKPVVAAVNGSALAGGLDLALMCDVRVAAVGATFGQPQVRRGIPAAYELVAGVVGDAHARDLCLTGRIIDAHEALA
ncbi:MAG: enoyl-CoA hydratase/isomerase family protein, partial [Actinomycetota bacterium]|nr:enoyl-CoA hydratase/isomerase family protein [Actinomycetota bacterium]